MIKLNIIFPNIRLTSYPFNWNWNSATLIKILKFIAIEYLSNNYF